MRIYLLVFPAVASGFCGFTGESGRANNKYACLPQTAMTTWKTLAADNQNVDEGEFAAYRESARVAMTKVMTCEFSDNDVVLNADGYGGKLSNEANLLRSGARPKGYLDFGLWKLHPLAINPSKCKCPQGFVPIQVVDRTENFYDPKGDMTKSVPANCLTLMSGFRNYYQSQEGCKAPGKPNYVAGFKDNYGRCIKKGETNSLDGLTVIRGSYKPPVCHSIRLVGQESKVLTAAGSCECCGDYEFESPSDGIVIYAAGGVDCENPAVAAENMEACLGFGDPPVTRGGMGGGGGSPPGLGGGLGSGNGDPPGGDGNGDSPGGDGNGDGSGGNGGLSKENCCCLIQTYHQRQLERSADALSSPQKSCQAAGHTDEVCKTVQTTCPPMERNTLLQKIEGNADEHVKTAACSHFKRLNF